MRKILMLLGFVMISILPMQAQAGDQGATLYAVSFHADWCGSCKTLGPQVIKARGKADLDNQNVLFVKLDLTDGAKRHQSGLMAEALGIGEFYKQNKGKTGFVLLVNSKTKETLGKLTKEHGANDIISMIKEKSSAL